MDTGRAFPAGRDARSDTAPVRRGGVIPFAGPAGPRARPADLAKALAAREGGPKRVIAFRIRGADRLFEAGELLPSADVAASGPGFDQWLAARPGP